MAHGISKKQMQILTKVFEEHQEVEEAILFGSRAKGTHKPGSDVDICLKGCGVANIAAAIAGILNDESPLPYVFDIIAYSDITNEQLKQHIARVGLTIYNKKD